MGAEAEALDREHLEAKLPFLRPYLRAAVDVDAFAVRQVEPEGVEAPPRQGCFDTRAAILVLEREEHGLPALLAPQLGHLALDPHGREPAEPVGEPAVEGGDGEDLAVAVLDRLDLRHAGIVRPGVRKASDALASRWGRLGRQEGAREGFRSRAPARSRPAGDPQP